MPSPCNSAEVWFELGEHSGECVSLYVPEIVNDGFGTMEYVQSDWPIFVERYHRREFGFEFIPSFPGDNGACDLLLVFLAADPVEGHELEGHRVTKVAKVAADPRGVDYRRGAMFVPVPEVVQDVE